MIVSSCMSRCLLQSYSKLELIVGANRIDSLEVRQLVVGCLDRIALAIAADTWAVDTLAIAVDTWAVDTLATTLAAGHQ